jgi:uroporphyrin-3 C-methyltransferase
MSETDKESPDIEATAEEQTANEEQPAADESSPAPEEEAPKEETPKPARRGNGVAWLAVLVSLAALVAAGYTAWQSRQLAGDTSVDDSVARLESRLSAAASASTVADLETRVSELADRDSGTGAALDTLRRDVDERVSLLDSLPARMSTLESSVASLAGVSEGARDAWVLAESEYYMQIANAQLQLANNPHLAGLALRMADERIVQLANPALTDVRRAIADELAALDVMDKPDVEGATMTLASLARVVNSLPLAVASESEDETAEVDDESSGAARAWASVKNAFSGMVKVTSPDQAKLTRLSPDAESFLRNNIALQLQAARLALLRGEPSIFEQTLDDTSALLVDYFDTDSPQVAGALETIAEIRGQVFAAEVPDISESLRLLRQYRTLSESAQ